jgi:hypothetical protein
MAIDGGRITAFLDRDTSGYGSAMDVAKKKLSVLSDSSASWSAKLTGVGDALQTVGSTLTTRATVPIVALGTAAAKAAIPYESAFAGGRKPGDAPDSAYPALSDRIKDMSDVSAVRGGAGPNHGDRRGWGWTRATVCFYRNVAT